MEAQPHSSVPFIRTAMRMSRRTIKVPKHPDLQPFQRYSSLVNLPGVAIEAESVQPAPIPPVSRFFQRSSLPEVLVNSPYLSPVARRKPQWGHFREVHKDKMYENWEQDECALEQGSPSVTAQKDGSVTAKASSDFRQLPRKMSLFRPRPSKLGKSLTTSTSRPTATVSPKVRHYSTSNNHLKTSKSVHFPALKEATALPLPAHRTSTYDLHIEPVVYLTAIESEELDESPAKIEEVLEILRERKSGKVAEKPPEVALRRASEVVLSSQSKYCNETAMVLGDTSSIVKRRNERMIIPERLFRHSYIRN